jgi:hypothetical protein
MPRDALARQLLISDSMLQEAALPPLNDWETFYVIVGSSAGALTGLMFVVITLIAGRPGPRASGEISAYGTPNVVHFSAVLILSALLSAPWESLSLVGVLLVLLGLSGVAYAAIIFRRLIIRARLQETYNPVVEDWIWFGILPFIAYSAIAIAALTFFGDSTHALFVIAAAMILLLLIGIHNAWDTVTYIAFDYTPPSDEDNGNQTEG